MASILMTKMLPSHRTRRLYLVSAIALVCSLACAKTISNEEARIASAIRNGDYPGALRLLGPAIRRSPANAELWTMQGVAYDRQGNPSEALAAFKNALKIAPNTIPALEGAAQIEFAASDPRAIPFLERLLRLRP